MLQPKTYSLITCSQVELLSHCKRTILEIAWKRTVILFVLKCDCDVVTCLKKHTKQEKKVFHSNRLNALYVKAPLG